MPGRAALSPSPILRHWPVSCFPVSLLLKSGFVPIPSGKSFQRVLLRLLSPHLAVQPPQPFASQIRNRLHQERRCIERRRTLEENTYLVGIFLKKNVYVE